MFHLGESAIDMCMEDTPPIQPSIVVLCRTTVFCLTTGGTVRWQIRLECVASAMMVYNTKKESPSIRLCVATTTNTLLIFLDNRLLWNCQTDFLPIAVNLSSYSAVYQNVLSLLSVDGRISIGYLGTEPNLYKVPIDNRFIDYKAKIQEMRNLEARIKDSGAAGSYHKSTFALKYTIGELDKATVEHDVNGEVPVCSISLRFEGTNGTQAVHINVRSTFSTSSKQIVISRPTDSTTVPIVFYVGSLIPTSTIVYLSAHCSGTQLSAFTTLRLPFSLLFCETSPDRNAKYKLTIDSDHPCIGLNNIFTEFQTENPSAIGFQVHSHSASISIFTANKTNRYRIQTDYPSLLFVVVSELVDRLKRAQNGVILHANTPLEYITPKLDDFIEVGIIYLEAKAKSERLQLEKRTREVRSIQALLLSKTKNTKPEPLDHIDLLFNNAHEQLLEAVNQLALTRERKKDAEEELTSLFDLLALVLEMDNMDTTLNGHIMSNTQQSLRDRLSWASRVSDDPSRMIAVLCQHTQKTLSQIREEDEKEDDFDAIHTQDIKL
uniref:Bardet-Biedl syndrome 2 protein homolog n=1 Tax=Heterorhabditis bacteriophora TaxID=37862 RepID=A0A1I7WZU5_HETBA